MDEAGYYLLIGDQENGPWTMNQVQDFWQAGAVTSETLYAQPGMSDWKPLFAILRVASASAPALTPPQESSYADEQWEVISSVVNAMLPLENAQDVSESEDMMDEPVEPDEMNLPKTRQWLRDKLLAIGFRPDTERSAVAELRFGHYLCTFTRAEQALAFGEGPLSNYRRGEITAAQLIGQGDSLIKLEKLRSARLAGNNQPTEAVERRGDVEQFTAEGALWIMAVVRRVSNALLPPTEPTEAEKEARAERDRRLRARMDQMDSSLSPINKVIQAAIAEFGKELSGLEPTREPPSDRYLTKLRLWLVATLGLKPEPEKPVIRAENFTSWLEELLDSEQNAIFGTENMELYRAGKLTSQDLLDELERVATCIATGSGNELER
jgi:hypothetical protein